MGYCDQGWGDIGRPQGTWAWAVLGSVLAHGLLVAGMLLVLKEKPAPRRVVVPVETIALVPMQPGPKGGGGGRPAPVAKPEPVAPKPAVQPPPKPRVKPPPQPKVKPAPPPPPEPMASPVIPRPAPLPAIARANPAPTGNSTGQAGTPGTTAGAPGSDQGGQGGGRRTGSGSGVGQGQGQGQGRGSGSGSALQSYLREVRRLLEKQKDYPGMARRRNIQGVVLVRFTILANGQVEASRVSRSSGQELLDEGAQNTIRRVGRFPPLPADLNCQKLTIEVPLAFRLHND